MTAFAVWISLIASVSCLAVFVPGAAAQGRLQATKTAPELKRELTRDNFALAAAQVLNRKPNAIQVVPVRGVVPSRAYASLTTGDLFAWTALDRQGRVLLNGFAGAGEKGPVAMEGYRLADGRPGGISSLLKALNALEPRRSIATARIVARVAFCLNRPDIGEFLFDPKIAKASGFVPPRSVRTPSIRMIRTGRELVYFTMVPGLTGTFDYWKISIEILPGYRALIRREPLR